MAAESEEEIQLKDVLDGNERTINKKQAEMRLLQAELLQLRSALLSRKEEASMLKGELRGKEREFRKLKAERAELLSRLDATKSSVQDFPGSDQSRLLEMYLLKRKETLKLVQYNNALRDREISKLERKLDGLQREISSKSTSPSQSKPDASAQASTFLENTLTPKALAKLQRHATKYGNSDQQRKVVADILGAGTYVMSDTGIRLPPLEDYSTRLHYREVEAATQRQRKTVKKLTCDKINAMCEIQSLKLRVDISEESNKGYRRQLDDMESVLKSVREKHHMEVETLKARQLELERQVSAMKRQNRTQRELMSGLKIENEMLKRKLASSQQKSGTIRPRTQTAKSQPYKSARRTASRSSSNKDFPRTNIYQGMIKHQNSTRTRQERQLDKLKSDLSSTLNERSTVENEIYRTRIEIDRQAGLIMRYAKENDRLRDLVQKQDQENLNALYREKDIAKHVKTVNKDLKLEIEESLELDAEIIYLKVRLHAHTRGEGTMSVGKARQRSTAQRMGKLSKSIGNAMDRQLDCARMDFCHRYSLNEAPDTKPNSVSRRFSKF